VTTNKTWQLNASFSHEVAWVGEMIIEDGRRILTLKADIKALELRCKALMNDSQIAQLIDSIPAIIVIIQINTLKYLRFSIRTYWRGDRRKFYEKCKNFRLVP